MARHFNGTTDKIQTPATIPQFSNLIKACISVWVRPDNLTTGNRNIFTKRVPTDAANGWGLQSSGGGAAGNAGLLFLASNAGVAYGWTESVAVLTAGVWTHVLVVYDGTQSGNAARLKIYANGVDQALTYSGTIAAVIGNPAPVVIGFAVDAGDNHWAGDIADVACWPNTTMPESVGKLLNMGMPTRDIGVINRVAWELLGTSPEPSNINSAAAVGVLTGTTFVPDPPMLRIKQTRRRGLRRTNPAPPASVKSLYWWSLFGQEA